MSQSVEGMFAAIARRYDLINSVLSFGLHHRWRRKAATSSGLRSGAQVLDLCSGTADLALAFARCVGQDGQVVATDFCDSMLFYGLQKSHQRRAPLLFALADAHYLPFPDASFDGVSVAFGLRNVDCLHTTLQEMFRVLRPGGVAVILEFGQPRGRLMGPLYRWYTRHVLPRIGAWLSGHAEAYSYLPRTAAMFPAGDEFCKEMATEQFVDVHAQALNAGIVYLYIASRPA